MSPAEPRHVAEEDERLAGRSDAARRRRRAQAGADALAHDRPAWTSRARGEHRGDGGLDARAIGAGHDDQARTGAARDRQRVGEQRAPR